MTGPVTFSSSLDLAARRPVWVALSTLFLDTDVSLDLAYRARVLAASPYALRDLEAILIEEVYPVCRPNLQDFAGEWGGFDPAWLEERILGQRRLQSLRRRRPWHRLTLARLTVPRWGDWIATRAAVAAARRGPRPAEEPAALA